MSTPSAPVALFVARIVLVAVVVASSLVAVGPSSDRASFEPRALTQRLK
ncbi:MAG TPA: hypothetical protein VLT33_29195 [Labilithrix sp.]|nr:hypothetical protein [Labilithrix sp.]